MARRRLVRIGQVVGGLGLRIAAVAVTLGARDGRPGPGSQPAEPASRTAVSNRPCAADIRSLAEWHKQLTPPQAREAQPPKPLTEAETMEWIDAAAAVRAGYPGLPAQGKLLTVEVMARILDRFSVEGTPAGWTRVLPLSFDVLAAGLADAQVLIRKTALDEVGRLWVWAPGCTMTPAEEQAVARWKEGLYPTVVRRLADPEAFSRLAAIACLGRLSIDEKATPAVAALRDPDFSIRFQVLTSFAGRPAVLTEEAVLPLLNDPIPDLRGLTERILQARGLSSDLIGLGRTLTHPEARMRASAIALILERDDIDPVVWLLHLTEDVDAGVRLRAVQALSGRRTPEVRRRLREMAAADESSEVRAAAAVKLVPADDQTAALPTLPGSSSLNPKAN